MRSFPAVLACLFLLGWTSAWADSRVFIVSNQADGYGVDQCLARGDKCGAPAAQASAYRRVDPDEITGSVPAGRENCSRSDCVEYVAITCQR